MHDHFCENAVGQDPKRHSGEERERCRWTGDGVHGKSGTEEFRRLREEDKKKKEKEKAAAREMLPCVVVADWAARTLGVCFTGPPSPSQLLSRKGTLAWRMRLGKKESRPPDKPAL